MEWVGKGGGSPGVVGSRGGWVGVVGYRGLRSGGA